MLFFISYYLKLIYVILHFVLFRAKAEWLGNDNRKTMIKVKTTGQMLPFKNGTALPSPSQAPGSLPYVVDCVNSTLNL